MSRNKAGTLINRLMTRTFPNRRKIHWLQILLLSVLLPLTAVIAYGLWYLSDPVRLKPFIENAVSELTQRTLRINGDFDYTLGKTITIDATNINWENPPWSSSPNMLRIDEAKVAIDLFSLFKGALTINEAQVKGGELLFEWRNGKMNWDMGNPNAPRSTAPHRPIMLALSNAHLSDVKLRFVHPSLPEELVLDIVKANEIEIDNNGIAVNADARIDSLNLKLRGTVGPFPELLVAGAINYQLQVNGTKARLDSAGSFSNLAHLESPNIELSYTAPELETILKVLKLPAVASGPVEIKGKLTTQGEKTDLNLVGNAGDFKVDALFHTTDLKDLSALKLMFKSSGPSARALGQIAGIDNLPESPYAISIKADRVKDSLRVSEFSAHTKSINIEGSGTAHKLPQFRDFDLQLNARADSLQMLGLIAGLKGLPDLPFNLTASASAADKDSLNVVKGTANLGTSTASFSSRISDKTNFLGSSIETEINSTDTRELAGLYNISLDGPTPLKLIASATLETQAVRLDSIELSANKDSAKGSGKITFAPTLDIQFDGSAEGANLRTTINRFLQTPSETPMPAESWQLSGKFGYTDNQLKVSNGNAMLQNAKQSFSGTVQFGKSIPTVDAALFASGENLAETLAFAEMKDIPAKRYSLRAQFKLSEKGIGLNNIAAMLNDDTLNGSIFSGWPEKPDNLKFNIKAKGQNLRATAPPIDGYTPPASAYFLNAVGAFGDSVIEFDTFKAGLGDARININGSLKLLPKVETQQISFQLNGPRLSDLGSFAVWRFKPVKFDISATMTGLENTLKVRDFSANVEGSNLKGVMEIDMKGTPSIAAKLSSTYINLNNLLKKVEQTETSDADNPSTGDQQKTPPSDSSDKKMLSATPIEFDLLQKVNADFGILFKEFVLANRTVVNLGLAGKLNDGVLNVPVIWGSTRYGNVKGKFTIDATQTPPQVEIDAAATDAAFSAGGLTETETSKLPRQNIITKLTSEGNSIAELGAALNGYFWMTGDNGYLPIGKLDFLFGDLFIQIVQMMNPFAEKQTYSEVSCDAVYLDITKGIVRTAPGIIVQTDKLSIVAAGSVDLRTEKLSLGFRTTPLRGIGISASDLVNPFVRLGGSLTKPQLVLDPASTAIKGGAAFFTMGASLLATNLWNRWVTSKDACSRMGQKAIKLRKKKHPKDIPVIPKGNSIP
ncbi:MAG: AsmA family protein [Chromatiales bacterium]|nr:AsmA family protein [Chromatiales bacterium]